MFDPYTDPFPLECWFDLASGPIPPAQCQAAQDRMRFLAHQGGVPRRDPGLQRALARLRQAVRTHNAHVEAPGSPATDTRNGSPRPERR